MFPPTIEDLELKSSKTKTKLYTYILISFVFEDTALPKPKQQIS